MSKNKHRFNNAGNSPVVIHTQEPPIVIQDIPDVAERDRRFWPENEPMPGYHIKARRRPLPCPKCRRVLLDTLGQAVLCKSSGDEVAFFSCMACGHNFQMPVKRY